VSPAGANWTESVLYSFGNDGDSANPEENLIVDLAGNLYGATGSGAGSGTAGVFELTTPDGGWTERLIYTYPAGNPSGLAMDSKGDIFGTGGSADGRSTVFELSPNGNGGWNPTVICTFADSGPLGIPVLDASGDLYGTAISAGSNLYGTIYKLSPGKRGKWTNKILHSFKAGKNAGIYSVAGVVLDTAGNIYGTTFIGGKYNRGIVFELVAPVGNASYKEKTLWSFNYADGAGPEDTLIIDTAGNLYGTTAGGGSGDYGVVFELTP
jgi:uncharacterized repeat protein (TIGR03803 family)